MVADGEIIELPNDVENIGDGINGGKPVLEVIGKFIGKFNGKGELNGTVVGDTLGDAVDILEISFIKVRCDTKKLTVNQRYAFI